jgi:hypothetical protein
MDNLVISLIALSKHEPMDELPLNKIIRLLLNAFSRTSYIYITVFHCFGYDNCHSAIAAEAGFVPCRCRN